MVDLSKLGQRATVTTVRGTGSVCGEFDRVRYSITIVGIGATGSEAKQGIKRPLAELSTFLKQMEAEGVKLTKAASPYRISKETHWDDEQDKAIFSHYAATYDLKFTVEGTDTVTSMMDGLTEINDVEVDSPEFIMGETQRRRLHTQALELAVDNAKARFITECSLLGQNSDDFEVLSWSTSGGAGPTGPQGASAASYKNSASRIVVSGGEARVSAAVNLSYTPTAKSLIAYAKDILTLAQDVL